MSELGKSNGEQTVESPAMRPVYEWNRQSRGFGERTAVILVCSVLLGGCGQKIANADTPPPIASVEPISTTRAVRAAPAVATRVEDESELTPEEEIELRRGYGAVDMRFDACVKRTANHALEGEGCPSGFIVYGPYVPVPARSEIDVTFDVRPTKRIEIYADIVSRMAAHRLAGLNRQVVEGGVNQRLGYRVHVSNAEIQVESRIGIAAEAGTKFEITNLTMTVR